MRGRRKGEAREHQRGARARPGAGARGEVQGAGLGGAARTSSQGATTARGRRHDGCVTTSVGPGGALVGSGRARRRGPRFRCSSDAARGRAAIEGDRGGSCSRPMCAWPSLDGPGAHAAGSRWITARDDASPACAGRRRIGSESPSTRKFGGLVLPTQLVGCARGWVERERDHGHIRIRTKTLREQAFAQILNLSLRGHGALLDATCETPSQAKSFAGDLDEIVSARAGRGRRAGLAACSSWRAGGWARARRAAW